LNELQQTNSLTAASGALGALQVCIAFAFAVSTAMEKTRLARAIADVFVGLSELSNACAGPTVPMVDAIRFAACPEAAMPFQRQAILQMNGVSAMTTQYFAPPPCMGQAC
jgi:hypothetical protein